MAQDGLLPKPNVYWNLQGPIDGVYINSTIAPRMVTENPNEYVSIKLTGESAKPQISRYETISCPEGENCEGLILDENIYVDVVYREVSPNGMQSIDSAAYLWGLTYGTGDNHNSLVDAEIDVQKTEYSVAAWFYIDPNANTPEVGVSTPETEKNEILIFRGGNLGHFGLKVLGDSLFLRQYRYASNDFKNDDSIYDLYQWEPVRLDDEGWYFIMLTQTNYVSRVFIGKPNSTSLSCRYLQIGLGTPDLEANVDYFEKDLGSYGFGNKNNSSQDVGVYIDDIMVWNRQLSAKQAQKLFNCSMTRDPNDPDSEGKNCWNESVNTGARLFESSYEEMGQPEISEPSLTVYPNPSIDGNFHIEMDLPDDTPLELVLYDLNGKILFTHEETMVSKGRISLALENIQANCSCAVGDNTGIFILKVVSKFHNESRKLQVVR